MNGLTDSPRTAKELMYIIFLDPDVHEVQLKFFSLRNAIFQTSEGILETFQSTAVSDVIGKKILYFASDNATVNSGFKNGLITKICKNFGEHINSVWCLAHCLDLAIKDAFKGSDMTEIERVLNLLYNLYKNNSKKWREIQKLFQSMKDDFDFEDSGLRPTKAYGKRWISHHLNAFHKFYNKFKVFSLHLENLIREATINEKSML